MVPSAPSPDGYRREQIKQIFLLALMLRALLAGIVFWLNPERLVGGAASYEGDGWYYDLLATNLLHHGVYSSRTAPPFDPHMARVPGYPAFQVVVYALFGHLPRMVIFAQLVVGSITCAITYHLAERLTGSERVARISALLLVFDLSSLIAAQELWSETLFTLFLLLNLASLWDYRLQQQFRYMLLTALWLGLATLVRPEAGIFALVEAALVFAWASRSLRRPLGPVVTFLVMVLFLLAPWLYRNWYHFRILALSSLVSEIMLFDSAALVEASSKGIPQQTVIQTYQKQITEYRHLQGIPTFDHPGSMTLKRRLALTVLTDHFYRFIQLQLEFSPIICLPHIPALIRILGVSPSPFSERREIWYQQGFLGLFRWFYNQRLVNLPWLVIILCLAWALFLFVVYIAALWGYLNLVKLGKWDSLTFLLVPILCLAFITQLAVLAKTPRHMVPLMPILLISAAIGITSWLQKGRKDC